MKDNYELDRGIIPRLRLLRRFLKLRKVLPALKEDWSGTYDQVESYCMFIGFGRSGHTLVASLLDAHREIVIAVEQHDLLYMAAGLPRFYLYYDLLENVRSFMQGRERAKRYVYDVPTQWQGRFDRLRVIGNKEATRTTRRLMARPDFYDKLRRIIGKEMTIKIIHVARNPFDAISNKAKQKRFGGVVAAWMVEQHFKRYQDMLGVLESVEGYDFHELRIEDFIAEPSRQLAACCDFLGVEASEDYLSDCADIVFTSPKKRRFEVEWSAELIEVVQGYIDQHEGLKGYSYES